MREVSMSERDTQSNITTAIFDFDGTIIDSSSAVLEVMRKLSVRYRLPVLSAEDLAEIRTRPLSDRLAILGIPRWKVPFIARTALRHFSNLMDSFPLYEGMEELLDELSRTGVTLYILSSNSKKNIRRCLKRHGISSFSAIRTASGLFSKARHLKRMMNRFDIDSRNAVYIGDELRDITAAHEAGLPAIAVSWGYDTRELLVQGDPERIVDSVDDLKTVIQSGLKA